MVVWFLVEKLWDSLWNASCQLYHLWWFAGKTEGGEVLVVLLMGCNGGLPVVGLLSPLLFCGGAVKIKQKDAS